MPEQIYNNLEDAGAQLARAFSAEEHSDSLVLAIANSGIPVAVPIAEALQAALDLVIIRRLFVRDGGARPVCAVSVAGNLLTDSELEPRSAIEEQFVSDATEALSRRVAEMRGSQVPGDLRGQKVILVDNGIHTGSTIEIALHAVRQFRPARITVGIPVCDIRLKDKIELLGDAVICLRWPDNFGHTGLWYKRLNRPSDAQVAELLKRSPSTAVRT